MLGRGAIACLALAALAIATARAEEGAASFAAATSGGDTGLELRYRYEFVDQESFEENANASTLRVRLNYKTKEWRRWTGLIEFDHVASVLVDDFNSGLGTSGPDRERYPVVADPTGSDLNQLYLQAAPREDVQLRFGRQRILLDDQRFVGGVGWRQNEQTYDALSIRYGGFERTTLFYSYVANVNRIFGAEVPAGDHDQDTHLLNVRVGLSEDWQVTGYAYIIDNDDAPVFSTRTLGIRVQGGTGLLQGRLNLLGEFALQSDAGDAPVAFDTDYYRLQLLWSKHKLTAGFGIESLGSDNGQGFRTPLATLHAFNGWADQFLATPAAGLEDRYLRLGISLESWKLELRFHDFSAKSGSADYASEIDFSLGRKFGDRYGLLVKLAAFDADSIEFSDVTKAWLMLTADF